MDFQPITSTCAKIVLTASEAAELGISFENFEKENMQTKAFLTYVLTMMAEAGLLALKTTSISVEVFEQENSSLIIYIMGKTAKAKDKEPTDLCFSAQKPYTLFQIVPEATKALEGKIISSELYEYSSHYMLIISVTCTKKTAQKRLGENPADITNPVTIAKIREYGKLLSDSPFNLFI